VIISRKDKSVAVDDLGIRWIADEPIMSRRDLFMQGKRNDKAVDFIRHDFWVNKLLKY
jgi:hypothetical protein